MRILLVDDDRDSGDSLREFLAEGGHQPTLCADAETALARFAQQPFPLVITDLRMPGMGGIELLDRLRAQPAGLDTDVIILTGHADLDTAVQALRRGAYDYIPKPVNAVEFMQVVERCAEHRRLIAENRALTHQFDRQVQLATQTLRADLDQARSLLRKTRGTPELVVAAPAMKALLERARLYHADPAVPVLIEGETGTGKELLARAVHFGDEGADAPFFEVNCSAIPASLFESELFGYEPGAFSGGHANGLRGKLELAQNGTLFLDEIGDLPLDLQPKLLRVLQDGSYYKLGGLKKLRFQARLVCASNQPLDRLAAQGKFRLDLLHRLKVGHLVIPPLRDRPEDIPALAQAFFRRETARKKRAFQTLRPDALALLQAQAWPGNVRELENAIERAVLENDGPALAAAHFAFLGAAAAPLPTPASAPAGAGSTVAAVPVLPPDRLDLEQWNEAIIRQALVRFENNITRTALFLGLSRNALYGRIKKMRGRGGTPE